MRRTRLPIVVSMLAAFAAASAAKAANNAAPTPLLASAFVGCPDRGFDASPCLASKAWDPKRRDAFARLLIAAERFTSAVALHETDRNVADGYDIVAAKAVERHVFRRTLEALVTEASPRAPLMSAREADGALNAAYSEVMAVEDPRNLAWGSVEKAGIRATERAWLAYRDAFVTFAATFETPGLVEHLKIELTMRRATSLEAFLAD